MLICACVAGHAAFGSDAAKDVGTVKDVLRLPSEPVEATPSEPRSSSSSCALDGLTIPARPLASRSTMSELDGRLLAAHEIVIVEPGVTPRTAAALGGVAALL